MAQKSLHKSKAEIKIIIELLNSKSLKRHSVEKKNQWSKNNPCKVFQNSEQNGEIIKIRKKIEILKTILGELGIP